MPFDTEKQQRDLDDSTFDIVRVGEFHNVRFGTVMSYLWVWILLILKLAILGSDTYTCISILVFKRWGTQSYEVYDYKVAKWIFTGCIGFRFILLAWQLAWAIHVYRTRNIALAYLNNYAKIMYAVRSYDYQCLFHDIELNSYFPWATFRVYFELDNALEVLVTDCPREVINVMTLKNYATGGDLNSNVLSNIKTIATTNVKLSVILSLMLCSVVIYVFFFAKFCLGMLCYIPVKVKVSNQGFKSVKSFCYFHVNEKVRLLVSRHHKPKRQLLLEGILDVLAINANPLLHSSSTLNLNGDDDLFTHPAFKKLSPFDNNSSSIRLNEIADKSMDYTRPPRAYTAGSLRNESIGSDSTRLGFARKDSSNSAIDPFGSRTFSRTQTSDTLVTARSFAERNPFSDERDFTPTEQANPFDASRRKPDPVVEEDASYHSQGSLTETRPGAGGSTDELVHHAVSEEPGLRDDIQSPLLDRDGASSPFSDNSQAPYPVRGVSRYFEN